MALNTSDILGTETLPWSGTSLSTNCTVPANCGAILAFLKRYTSGSVASISALTIGGNSATDTVAGTSTDEACAFARIYPGLSSGTQAVSGTASSTSAQDTTDLVLVYLSTDVSSVGFRAKNALASGPLLETAKTFTLSGLSVGDLVFQFDSGNQAGSNVPPGLPAGWTSVLTYANDTQPSYFRLSTIVATGSTQSCASQPEINWSALAGVAVYEVAASGATITNVSDTTLANGQTGVVITGTNFEASQGTGVVKISPTDNINDAGAVTQNIASGGWSDTSITLAALKRVNQSSGTAYVFVDPDAGDPNTSGYAVSWYDVVATIPNGTPVSDVSTTALLSNIDSTGTTQTPQSGSNRIALGIYAAEIGSAGAAVEFTSSTWGAQSAQRVGHADSYLAGATTSLPISAFMWSETQLASLVGGNTVRIVRSDAGTTCFYSFFQLEYLQQNAPIFATQVFQNSASQTSASIDISVPANGMALWVVNCAPVGATPMSWSGNAVEIYDLAGGGSQFAMSMAYALNLTGSTTTLTGTVTPGASSTLTMLALSLRFSESAELRRYDPFRLYRKTLLSM